MSKTKPASGNKAKLLQGTTEHLALLHVLETLPHRDDLLPNDRRRLADTLDLIAKKLLVEPKGEAEAHVREFRAKPNFSFDKDTKTLSITFDKWPPNLPHDAKLTIDDWESVAGSSEVTVEPGTYDKGAKKK